MATRAFRTRMTTFFDARTLPTRGWRGLALFGSGEVGFLLGKSQVAGRAQSAGAKPVSWTEPSPRTSPGVVLQFEQR